MGLGIGGEGLTSWRFYANFFFVRLVNLAEMDLSDQDVRREIESLVEEVDTYLENDPELARQRQRFWDSILDELPIHLGQENDKLIDNVLKARERIRQQDERRPDEDGKLGKPDEDGEPGKPDEGGKGQ